MFPKEARRDLVFSLFGGMGSFSQMKVRLAKAEPAPALVDLVLGDIEEADFVGYSEISAPGGTSPAFDASDNAFSLTNLLEWTAGELTGPQEIHGIYVVAVWTVAGTKLLFYFPLDPTVTLTDEGQKISRRIYLASNNLVVA